MARRGRMGRGVAPTERQKISRNNEKADPLYGIHFKIQTFFRSSLCNLRNDFLILPDQRFSERRQQKSSMVLSVRFQADQAWNFWQKSERFWRQH